MNINKLITPLNNPNPPKSKTTPNPPQPLPLPVSSTSSTTSIPTTSLSQPSQQSSPQQHPHPALQNSGKPLLLLIGNAKPHFFHAGGYCLQMHYLIQMFREQYTILYMSIGTTQQKPHQVCSFQEMMQCYPDSDITKYKIQRNSELYPYLMEMFYIDGIVLPKYCVEIGYVNDVITAQHVQKTIFLGDAFLWRKKTAKLLGDNYFWFPCHYFPLSSHDKDGLSVFKHIVCLTQSVQTMIQYLEQSYEKEDQHQLHLIPHIIEPGLEKTVKTVKTVAQIRQQYGVPENAFVILINASFYERSNRKNPDGMLFAFAKFLQIVPTAFLFIHSAIVEQIPFVMEKEFVYPVDVYPGREFVYIEKDEKGNETFSSKFYAEPDAYPGKTVTIKFTRLFSVYSEPEQFPIQELVNTLQINHAVKHHQIMLETAELNELYQMSNVLLMTSCSEGFGIPIMEAQRMGLPVITTKFLAMADYNIYGYTVANYQQHYNEQQDGIWAIPNTDEIVQCLQQAYTDYTTCQHPHTLEGIVCKMNLDNKRYIAQSFIQATMSYENVKKQWLKTIEK